MIVSMFDSATQQLRKKLTFRRLPVSDLTAYVLQLGQQEISSHVMAKGAA